MENLKLYGYVCGKQEATIIEELSVAQLQSFIDKGWRGLVGPTMCGCDMWEQLLLKQDGRFLVLKQTRSLVPIYLEVLTNHIVYNNLKVYFNKTDEGLIMETQEPIAAYRVVDGKLTKIF